MPVSSTSRKPEPTPASSQRGHVAVHELHLDSGVGDPLAGAAQGLARRGRRPSPASRARASRTPQTALPRADVERARRRAARARSPRRATSCEQRARRTADAPPGPPTDGSRPRRRACSSCRAPSRWCDAERRRTRPAARGAGRAPAPSMTCSGHPSRALAASASASRHEPVVPAPDQRRRDRDPRELVVGNALRAGCDQPLHRALHAAGAAGARGARPEGVEPLGIARTRVRSSVVERASARSARCCARSDASAKRTAATAGRAASDTARCPARRRSTSRAGASPCSAAKRAARLPPSECATSVGASSHVSRSSSREPARERDRRRARSAGGSDAPSPGRSGTITRWRSARAGDDRRPHGAAALDAAVQQDERGAAPPSSTAVETPGRVAAVARSPAGRRACGPRGASVAGCSAVAEDPR